MKATLLAALLICSLAAAPALKPAPATKPTGRPATKPAPPARVRDGLRNGAIRFLVPKDWELVARAEDGLSCNYAFPDEKGGVKMLLSQQATVIPTSNPQLKAQLSKFVLDNDNQDLASRKMEIIDAPKIEPDPRFMVKVHERFKDGETVVDALHLYRGVGINLVSVTITANTEDKEEVKTLHEAGALMLLSVTTNSPDPKVLRPVQKRE